MSVHHDPVAELRRAVVLAGHTADVATARAALSHHDPNVRSAALGALERAGALDAATIVAGFDDDDPSVRRRVAELAATHPDVDLLPLLHDPDPAVVEVAAWACGEHEADRDAVVDRLVALARDHDDAIVRESAVAALGAIGAERAVDTIIAAATGDRPAVRRRAVLALAPFGGAEVDEAITRALADRDWQVRQAAEDLRPDERASGDRAGGGRAGDDSSGQPKS